MKNYTFELHYLDIPKSGLLVYENLLKVGLYNKKILYVMINKVLYHNKNLHITLHLPNIFVPDIVKGLTLKQAINEYRKYYGDSYKDVTNQSTVIFKKISMYDVVGRLH